MLRELALYAGRLNYWLDLAIPWNDINELIAPAGGRERGMSLEGQAGVVTGTGVARRAIALSLSREGARVAVVDREQALAEETVELVRSTAATRSRSSAT